MKLSELEFMLEFEHLAQPARTSTLREFVKLYGQREKRGATRQFSSNREGVGAGAGISSRNTSEASWFSTHRVSHRFFRRVLDVSGHFSAVLPCSNASRLLDSLKKLVAAFIEGTADCSSRT